MHHHQYGTFTGTTLEPTTDDDNAVDVEQACCVVTPLSLDEKDAIMRPLADQAADQDSVFSQESCDSAQAGVKRLEAISSTWSKTGLFVAYVG